MPDDQELIKTFQLIFWGVSICLVIASLYVSVLGWKVNGRNSLQLAIKKDISDSIDRTSRSLLELEDAACSFWMEKDSKIKYYQVLNLHTRLVSNLKILNHLRQEKIPNHDLMMLRRYCTLDGESARRPISASTERIRNISRNVNNILNSEIMQKSWTD